MDLWVTEVGGEKHVAFSMLSFLVKVFSTVLGNELCWSWDRMKLAEINFVPNVGEDCSEQTGEGISVKTIAHAVLNTHTLCRLSPVLFLGSLAL